MGASSFRFQKFFKEKNRRSLGIWFLSKNWVTIIRKTLKESDLFIELSNWYFKGPHYFRLLLEVWEQNS